MRLLNMRVFGSNLTIKATNIETYVNTWDCCSVDSPKKDPLYYKAPRHRSKSYLNQGSSKWDCDILRLVRRDPTNVPRSYLDNFSWCLQKSEVSSSYWLDINHLIVTYRGVGRTRTMEIVKKPSGLPQSYQKSIFSFEIPNYFSTKDLAQLPRLL